jgi:hypothetical protein
LGSELKITGFNCRKTGLFKPAWLADLLIDQAYLLFARETDLGESVFPGWMAGMNKFIETLADLFTALICSGISILFSMNGSDFLLHEQRGSRHLLPLP